VNELLSDTSTIGTHHQHVVSWLYENQARKNGGLEAFEVKLRDWDAQNPSLKAGGKILTEL